MLTQVAINRETGDGKNADVLDVLEELADVYGSAANAAVQVIRKSKQFEETLPKISKNRKKSSQ